MGALVGTPALMAISSAHLLILVAGGLALGCSVVLGVLGRRSRIGKAVLRANEVLAVFAALFMIVATGTWQVRGGGVTAAMEQARQRQVAASEAARAAAMQTQEPAPGQTALRIDRKAILDNVVILDVHSIVASDEPAQLRLQLDGPPMTFEQHREVHQRLFGEGVIAVAWPRRVRGNDPRLLLIPGKQQTRVSFAFPTTELAREAHDQIAVTEAEDIIREAGLRLFEIAAEDDQNYRAAISASPALRDTNPDWVQIVSTVNVSRGQGMFGRADFTWRIIASRPGYLRTSYAGSDRVTPLQQGNGTDQHYSTEVRAVVVQSSTTEVQTVVGERSEEHRYDTDFDLLVNTLELEAMQPAVFSRGETFELFRWQEEPWILEIAPVPSTGTSGLRNRE